MTRLITILIAVTILLFTTMGIAQQAAQQQQTQKTLGELQWQARALQQEANYIQERLKTIQSEFTQVQEQIKALQPPAPAPVKPKEAKPEKPKNEPDAKDNR